MPESPKQGKRKSNHANSALADPIRVEIVGIDLLVPDPANPRRISDSELDKLTRSISEFGFVDPVIARRADHTVIGGHSRLIAARRLGHTKVPVIYVDFDQERARLLNVALNKIGGDFDHDLLAHLLAQIEESDSSADLTLSGFQDDELRDLLDSIDGQEKRSRTETFDVDDAMARSGVTRSKPGCIWVMGPHRLMCGDATSDDHVKQLIQDEPARMSFSDPPYNVDYQGGNGTRSRSRKKITNDALSPDELKRFSSAWNRNLIAAVDGALYVCMSAKEWPVVAGILEEHEAHWSTTIIWSKNHFTLGRSDYQRGYELLWYGWTPGSKRIWNGGRKQSDVWKINRPAESRSHPTMKPLELVERTIENSSNRGDSVLDLFTGSGTTLISCERTGRVFRGLEIDPHYADVAVDRWESFTGEKAELLREGTLS